MKQYRETLNRFASEGRLRRLSGSFNCKYDLSDNDYLGLARDETLRSDFLRDCDEKLTTSASRLLASNQDAAFALERELGNAYNKQVLLFNSGYHANVGAVSALANQDTVIVADKLIHASIIDGIKLSGSRFVRFKHNDTAHLARILAKECATAKRVLLITESVFSMDGDIAPLDDIVKIKQEYDNVLLYVDEAHAIGVFGENGLGVVKNLKLEQYVDVLVGTFGKGVASSGAFIAANELIIEYLVNTARSFIFSTSLPPICHAWTLKMLNVIFNSGEKRAHLQKISQQFRIGLEEITGIKNPSMSQIVPWIVGSSDKAVAISEKLKEHGVNALPIRRPTVPVGTERIRFSLNASLSEDDINEILKIIKSL